jgi:hypothetical protein
MQSESVYIALLTAIVLADFFGGVILVLRGT